MNQFFIRYKDFIVKVSILLLIVLFVYVTVMYIFPYVAPFAIAFIISLMLEPIIQLMVKKLKLTRTFASLIAVVFVLYIAFFLLSTIVINAAAQAKNLIIEFPVYLTESIALFDNFNNNFISITETLPIEVREFFGNTNATLIEVVTKGAGDILKNQSFSFVTSIPHMLMFTLALVLSTFFFCKDKKLIGDFIKENIPKTIVSNYFILKNNLFDAVIGYVKAQCILMTFTFTICFTSLSVQKSEYALLAALLIALIDALPVLGAGFILWPWAFINFLQGDYRNMVWLLVTYLACLITRQMLEPKVLGTQIGLHPIVILMSIYVGLRVFGPLGFILGPMTVIIVKTLNSALKR